MFLLPQTVINNLFYVYENHKLILSDIKASACFKISLTKVDVAAARHTFPNTTDLLFIF